MSETTDWLLLVGILLASAYPLASGLSFSLAGRILGANGMEPARAKRASLPYFNAILMAAVFLIALPIALIARGALPAGALSPTTRSTIVTWIWCVVAVGVGALAYVALRAFRDAYDRMIMRVPALAGGSGGAVDPAQAQAAYVLQMESLYHMTRIAALPPLLLANVGEEVIWRGFMMHALGVYFAIPLWSVLILTAVGFGFFMHATWGRREVLAHCLLGLVLGGLYWASGFSLIVPIVAHATYNVILAVSVQRIFRANARASATPASP